METAPKVTSPSSSKLSNSGLYAKTPDPTLKTAFQRNLRSILGDPADFLADRCIPVPVGSASYVRLDCLRLLVCGIGNGVSSHPGLKTSRFSQTPIHIAAFAGHPHCLQWLLQAGADPNAQDYLGETSLHKAARTGSLECVNILLASKASIRIRNNNGQTAAQLANACSYGSLANHLSQIEEKQGVAVYTSSSIARSVPAHGLNGGVFPHCDQTALFTSRLVSEQTANGQSNTSSFTNHGTESNGFCTSSNGYYGFQPTNGAANGPISDQKNGHSEPPYDCDMETDCTPVKNGLENGFDAPLNLPKTNSVMSSCSPQQTDNITLGFTNGHVIGTVLGLTSSNGIKSPSSQYNGHNRMGEDVTLNPAISQNYAPIAGCKRSREDVHLSQIKRMRTEDVAAKFGKSA
ncbi:Amyloid protein-binding protein 2 [Halocaridina rubra]|uniref:Amyloid protein-binding protein 2 n=1 Tax=Halocaridina rubra TaxID=373956 RepID=A0AAN9AGL1_HALRR